MQRLDSAEFRLGWRYLLGAFLGIAGGFASLYFYAAGLFITPMQEAFGWSRAEASIGSIAMSIAAAIALPVAGRLSDRHGAVLIGFLSSLGLVVGFLLLSKLTVGLVSFFSFVFLLTFFSAGTTQLTYNSIIVRQFSNWRGLALGLVMAGTGAGSVLVPLLLTPFIAEHGWQAGYAALAACAFPLGMTAALLLRDGDRDSPEQPRRQPDPWLQICRNPAIATIGAIILLAATAVLGSTLHLVPMLTDRGMTPVAAGGFASALGFAVIFGRVFTGILLDRFNPGAVAAGLLLIAGCGQLALAIGSAETAFLGAILLGFGLGTESDLLAFLLGRRVETRNFTTGYGLIFGIHAIGSGVGGYLAGYIFDVTGGYGLWLVIAALAMATAALIALLTETRVERPTGKGAAHG